MHLYRKKEKIPHKGILGSVLLFACLVGYFLYGVSDVAGNVSIQEKEALENAIQNAMVSCYAIEGCYPKDLAYMEEHYGIVIDYETFIVEYQPLGSNIKPSVQIYLIGEELQ